MNDFTVYLKANKNEKNNNFIEKVSQLHENSFVWQDNLITFVASGSTEIAHSVDGNLSIVFSGILQNKTELFEELSIKEDFLKSEKQSEILLYAFELWGASLLSKIRGTFAFAIWNNEEKELFVARDIFGVMPILYTKVSQDLIVSNCVKTFFEITNFRKELNERALEQYLSFGYNAGPELFYKNIYRLFPSHYFRHKDYQMQIKKYFLPKFTCDKEEKSFINQSCKDISDIVDKYEKNSVNFCENLEKNLVSKYEFISEMKKASKFLLSPNADFLCASINRLFENTSETISCIIGLETLFVLDENYLNCINKIANNAKVITRIFEKNQQLDEKKYIKLSDKKSEEIANAFLETKLIFSEKARKRLLKNSTKAQSPQEIILPYYHINKEQTTISNMQFCDINTSLSFDKVLKISSLAQGNNKKIVFPYLDIEIVKKALRMPISLKIEAGKNPFKDKLQKNLNHCITQWFKDDDFYLSVKNYFESDNAKEFFSSDLLLKLLSEHRQEKTDNCQKILCVLSFLLWYETNF